MNIEVVGQAGVIGDFVSSSLGARGDRHFVTPRYNTTGMADYEIWWKAVSAVTTRLGKTPPIPKPSQMFALDVVLKASDSASFAGAYEWKNANPLFGMPDMATVSRRTAGHFQVQIKRKGGGTAAELNVWVVHSIINAIPLPDRILSQDGRKWPPSGGFSVEMGYIFDHEIQPRSIITRGDRPDLSGRSLAFVPSGTNYEGNKLQLGVNSKWDTSRILRQKVLNPNRVSLGGSATRFKTFPNYPSMADGDGHRGGAGAISFRDWLIVGNDDSDADSDYNDENPYDRQKKSALKVEGIRVADGSSARGKLRSVDWPGNSIGIDEGSDHDNLEWRMHFQEFTRLEINRKWYLISERFPWRVHTKFVKASGLWRNNGSEKALDNESF